MKKRILLLGIFSAMYVFLSAQQTFTIIAEGFSFSPSTLTITQNDIVQFNTSFEHPVLQVSQSTWNSNGSTPLSGGFSFPSGSGTFEADAPGTIYYICTLHIGSGMKGRIVINAPTGTNDVSAEDSFKIYPGFATNFLHIVNAGHKPLKGIKIIDVSGKIIHRINEFINTENDLHIDITHFNKGLFFIILETEDARVSKKFVKL